MSISNPMFIHGNFSWQEHHGSVAGVEAFYKSVLGWDIEDVPHQGGATYSTIKVGGQPVGGFVVKDDQPAFWLPYITVDNVDDRVEKAVAEGGSILVEPNSAPGVGRIAVISDPQGAKLALITYESMM